MKSADARYLLGAMLADGVDGGVAEKVAAGYAAALDDLGPNELLQWRMALLARLGAGIHTAFALHCSPSDHAAPQYMNLANSRRKE